MMRRRAKSWHGSAQLDKQFTPPVLGVRPEALSCVGSKMSTEQDEALLKKIGDMLADGLKTQTEPFPETDKEFAGILDELRKLPPDDLEQKLVISGFVDKPYGPDKQRCMECMYYLVHRKWCDLPELSVPVEPEWWCRLWRI